MQQTTPIKTKIFFTDALKDIDISINRRDLLLSIAQFIASEIKKEKTVNLNFICTHNSRRSQIAQVWAHYAIAHFGLKNIASFSGGTEATAFHKNTVQTLQVVGFEFNLSKFSHTNPIYEISSEDLTQPIIGFSKIYDDVYNQKPFIAITTCSSAHENCPFIADALKRFHVAYQDPKSSDNTEFTSVKYLLTNKKIAGEVHFLFQTVSNLI